VRSDHGPGLTRKRKRMTKGHHAAGCYAEVNTENIKVKMHKVK